MQPNMNRAVSTSQAHDPNADIAELRKLLSDRYADPRKQRFRSMYDTIQELIAAGVSNAAIIRKLKSMGLSISPVTFKNWLAELQRERERTAVSDQHVAGVSQVRDAIQRGAK